MKNKIMFFLVLGIAATVLSSFILDQVKEEEERREKARVLLKQAETELIKLIPKFTGYNVVCLDGVQYYESTYKLAPRYTADGRLQNCE